MAAHGGSAASSALKGLIQQFTAITGKRRGYRKVESGVWSGRPVCPGLLFTFMHSSLGLYPQLPSSLLRKKRRRRRVSGFRRETAPPHPRAPHAFILGLLAVWRGISPPPFSLDSEWAEPIRPRRPGDLGAGEVGGRTRATALLLHHHLLFSLQPWGAAHPLTSFPLFSMARSFFTRPWPALPLSGPLGAIAVALACSGPPALTARLVGSAAPLPISGDRPPESRGC